MNKEIKTLNLNFFTAISLIILLLILVIFCVFFTSRLAQLKNRSRAWGILGMLLTIVGLVIVCYLPSKRDDNIETNPIKYFINKIPSVSKKTITLIISIAVVITLTIIAYDNIPKIIENHKHTRQVTKQNISQYAQPNTLSANPDKIFTGTESSFVISNVGNVYCWGKQISKPIENTDGLIYKDAIKVACNSDICLVLTINNELYGMGNNEKKLLPSELEFVEDFIFITNNVTDFSLSEVTIGIIKTDNKLYMCGDNSYGQLGTYNYETKNDPIPILGNVYKVHCEASFTIALQKTGEVVAFGENKFSKFGLENELYNQPTVIYNDIKDIAAGDDFILLLTNSGEVLSAGNNSCGQLGNASNESSTHFITVLSGINSISASKKTAFALTPNGELYAWGQNNAGQLGNGSEVDINIPTSILQNVTSVSTSGLHTVVLTTEGKLLSTGLNTYKQLGKGKARNKFSEFVSIK